MRGNLSLFQKLCPEGDLDPKDRDANCILTKDKEHKISIHAEYASPTRILYVTPETAYVSQSQ
jgi:hypothetical protein